MSTVVDAPFNSNNVDANRNDSTEVLSESLRSSPPHKSSTSNKFWITVNQWWLWEFLSCLTAVAALLAIIFILNEHNNGPLPNWPYRITINSLLSVLATVLKAAMMVPISQGRVHLLRCAVDQHSKP